nr:carboxypeptidase-like regulatory domain-containing protein [Bacteroidaceae bacterium]
MKRILLLLSLLLCLPLSAQQTYRARVVDAETGEALPYVSIYVAAGRGTITNSNGYFVIEAEPTVQLSFRY